MDFFDMGTSVDKVLFSLSPAKCEPEFKYVVERLEDELEVISDILFLLHPASWLSIEERLDKIFKIRRKQAVKRMEESLS